MLLLQCFLFPLPFINLNRDDDDVAVFFLFPYPSYSQLNKEEIFVPVFFVPLSFIQSVE